MLLREDLLLRLPPGQEEDEPQGVLDRLRAAGPNRLDVAEFLVRRALDLPEGVEAGPAQGLRLHPADPGDARDLVHVRVRELAPHPALRALLPLGRREGRGLLLEDR